ncbi:hypothetical protein, partial [Microcoleus sp. herbarium14]|uniref:hypothetical protein n=1 Tax=Microcoleus sp. herbarium14 TaxID=3055439 RepID=UPI002FD5E986
FDRTLVPPQRFGGRQGDLALIVKQQSVTGFNVKLTLMGSRSVLVDHSGAAGIEIAKPSQN